MTTREEIIAAAKESGFLYYGEFPQDYKCKIEALYSIAFEAGRVAGREECAIEAEYYEHNSPIAKRIAKDIRARNKK